MNSLHLFITGDINGNIQLFDFEALLKGKFQLLHSLPLAHKGRIRIIHPLEDEPVFFSVADDKLVISWRIDATGGSSFGKMLKVRKQKQFQGFRGLVTGMILLSKYLLVTCSDDKRIYVWNYITRKCVKMFTHDDMVVTLCRMDNKRFLSCGWDSKVKLWDVDKNLLFEIEISNSMPKHRLNTWKSIYANKFIGLVDKGKYVILIDEYDLKILSVETKRIVNTIPEMKCVGKRTFRQISDNEVLFTREASTLTSYSHDKHKGVKSANDLPQKRMRDSLWGNPLFPRPICFAIVGKAKRLQYYVATNNNCPERFGNYQIYNLEGEKIVENKTTGDKTSPICKVLSCIQHMNLAEFQKQENERLDFIKDDSFYNVVFDFNGTEIPCYRSMLVNSNIDFSKCEKKTVSFDTSLPILTDSDVVDLLFAEYSFVNNHSKLMDFFIFFQQLEMKNWMFFICHEVENNVHFDELLKVFDQAVKHFDEKVVLPLSLKSIFTLSVFNGIKREIELMKQGNVQHYKDQFRHHEMFNSYQAFPIEKLKQFENVCLLNFVNSQKTNIMYSLSTLDYLYLQTKKSLFQSKIYTNIKLITIDQEESEDILAHTEILIHSSNFFFAMLRFQGIESEDMNEKNEITIEILNYKQLFALIEFIYCRKISNLSVEVHMKLLEFSCMFFDDNLQEYLLEKLESFSENDMKMARETESFLNLPDEIQSCF